MYEIEYEPSVVKQIKDLRPTDQKRVMERIGALTADPRPKGCEKLAGTTDGWRIRSGDYRVVYRIDDSAQVVTVTRVGHRREVYRRR